MMIRNSVSLNLTQNRFKRVHPELWERNDKVSPSLLRTPSMATESFVVCKALAL